MDHLAPSSGVNWYTSYNAFGELLATAPQLPPMELGGVDVGRPYNPQEHVHYPTQVEGLHYGQEVSHSSVLATEGEHLVQEKPLSPAQSKAFGQMRVSIGEKIACQECGATFACGANLRNHMRIHTGERPFVCEECGASFTQRSNMRSHKRVHTGERPYMCGICGQTFARSSHLPGHMRTHTGEKPFTCSQCGRSFATNQIMKNHMRTHTGERPFVCDVCDATFAQSSCLATHKKIHTGERNFKCGKCGKAFISRSGLQTHERVHTGEKPYNCERCDKSFRTSSYLSKHRQKYCGNESFVKINRQSEPGKTKKRSSSSHRLSKCKKNLKPMNSPSKRTRVKRTQRPKRNKTSLCKSVPKPDWCRLLEKDPVTERSLQNTENSETDLAVYNQGETRKQGLDRSQEDNLVEDLDIKEECILPETDCAYETTTKSPQKQLTVDCEIVQMSSLHGENFGDADPLKGTFKDSQSQVQDQGTGAHQLIENYFKEMNSASFSESAYEEEISNPAVVDVQEVCEDLPQLSGIAMPSDMPQQTYSMKDDPAPWYSRSYM